MSIESAIDPVLGKVRALLVSKNQAYGNSAMEPVRVFSRASALEGLLVRADDKLSRLRTLGITRDGEDTLLDLIGYLILIYCVAFMGGNNAGLHRVRRAKTASKVSDGQSARDGASGQMPRVRKQAVARPVVARRDANA